MRGRNVLTGFAFLFAFLALGEAIVRTLGLPVPGNVLGMLLLAAALLLGIVRVESVERVADGLLEHLGLLFAPPGVGVMLHFDLIRREWLSISVALVLSTFVVLAATGGVAEWMRRKAGASHE